MQIRNTHITIISVVIVIVIFSIYFYILNIVLNFDNKVYSELNNIEEAALNNKVAVIQSEFNNLEKTWDTSKYIVSINYAEIEYDDFTNTISRLKGAIIVNDSNSIVREVNVAKKLISSFTKPVTLP